MVRHIKAAHPEAYANTLASDRADREQRAKERAAMDAAEARREASKTPYQRGMEAAHTRLDVVARYNVRLDDNCPYKKGTPEEAEYDRGWKAAMKRSLA
jgi:hypothetical protein